MDSQPTAEAVTPLTRQESLLQAVDEMLAAHADWQAKADKPYLTEPLESIIDDVLVLFGHGDIPGELRKLTIAVLAMRPLWESWRLVANMQTARAPGNEFWAAFEQVRKARLTAIKPPPKKLEPVRELLGYQTPCNPQQICQTYGWIDANGQPELWKVREEAEQPNKWSYDLYPDRWMPPHERAAAEEAARDAASIERMQRSWASREAGKKQVAKETYQSLHALANMTLPQLAAMKKVSIAEAAEELERLGLSPLPMAIDVHSLESALETQPQSFPEIDAVIKEGEAGEVGDPSLPLDLDGQILYYAKQGYSNTEVAEMVSTADTPVSAQKVAAIVRVNSKK